MNTILTDDEREEIFQRCADADEEVVDRYGRAIEAAVLAKLREQEPLFWAPPQRSEDWTPFDSETVYRTEKAGWRPVYADPLPAVVQVPLKEHCLWHRNGHDACPHTVAAPEAPAPQPSDKLEQRAVFPSNYLPSEVLRFANIVRWCGRIVDKSGYIESTLRHAAALLDQAERQPQPTLPTEAPAQEPAAIVKWSGGALAAHIVGEVVEGDLLYRAAAPEAPAKRCTYCDDTGDVNTPTGEWRGRCTCPAAPEVPAQGIHQQIEQARQNVAQWPQWMKDGTSAAELRLPEAPAQAIPAPWREAVKVAREAPLAGRWHHGNGVLVSGSIRVARWDCDTNPPDDFRDTVLDWVCNALNSTAALAQLDALGGVQ